MLAGQILEYFELPCLWERITIAHSAYKFSTLKLDLNY